MGTQIFIKQADMIAGGWNHEVEYETFWTQDQDGNEVIEKWPIAVFVKGDTRLWSYSTIDFSADCNEWGGNKAMFEQLGLFKLPYILS